MAKGTGAFVVAALCDRVRLQGAEEERKKLKKWFSQGVRDALKNSEVKGRDVLLESLTLLDQEK